MSLILCQEQVHQDTALKECLPEDAELKKQLDAYLAAEQIEPAQSPFGAGVLFAKQMRRSECGWHGRFPSAAVRRR